MKQRPTAPELSGGKEEVVSVGLISLLASVGGKFLSVPSSIIVAGLLGPGDYGLLALITVLTKYLSYTNLGFLTNLALEVPIAYGRGDTEEVNRIHSTVAFNHGVSTVLSLLLLLGAAAYWPTYRDNLGPGLVALVAFMVVAANANGFIHAFIKGEGKFLLFGKYEVVSSAVQPIITLLLVYFFGVYGSVGALGLVHLMALVYAVSRLGTPRYRPKFDWAMSKKLFRTGSLMYLNKVADSLLISSSIFLAGMYLPIEQVGMLSFALVIASMKKVPFAGTFAMIISRKMAVKVGQAGEGVLPDFRSYFRVPFLVFLILTTALVGAMVLGYQVSVILFLPEYNPSIPLFLPVAVGVFFYNGRIFVNGYLNAMGQLAQRTVSLFVGLAILAGGTFWVLKAGLGIGEVAWVLAIGFTYIAFHTIILVFRQVFVGTWYTTTFLVRFSVINLALGGGLLLASRFLVDLAPSYGVLPSLALAGALMGAFGVAVAGLYSAMFYRLGLFAELVSLSGASWRMIKTKVGGWLPWG